MWGHVDESIPYGTVWNPLVPFVTIPLPIGRYKCLRASHRTVAKVAHMEQNLAHRVAAEIRAEASRQRLSQSSLARAAGLTVPTTRRYFWTDEREPTLSAVIAVSDALGVPVAEIFRRAEAAGAVRVTRPQVSEAAPQATFQQPQRG